jgi:hypothetical protein
MERITFEIESQKEMQLLISIAEKLGIKKFIYSDSAKSDKTDIQKIYKIIDKGADISTFGDIKEWQRATRADRNLNFTGI